MYEIQTVNTASRMESTGEAGRVQISQETADLLIAAGKGAWFVPREEKVFAKGKGDLQTYWLNSVSGGPGTMSIGGLSSGGSEADGGSEELHILNQRARRFERLTMWNTELLCKYLKLVVARRQASQKVETAPPNTLSLPQSTVGNTVRDHLSDVIPFPEYVAAEASNQPPPDSFDSKITGQIHLFVQRISAMYRENPFHNFEHASHVTMSVSKLLTRIIAPDLGTVSGNKTNEMDLHDNTLGISSDPMMQFAMIFAALIHDVDHSGVVRMMVAPAFVVALNSFFTHPSKCLLFSNSPISRLPMRIRISLVCTMAKVCWNKIQST